MINVLQEAWRYQIELIPVLVALAIFELPRLVYKSLWPQHYVPVYLAVFPFNKLNQSISDYLGEDFIGSAPDLTGAQARSLRRRVAIAGVLTAFVGGVLIPGLTGFLGAFYLQPKSMVGFMAILAVLKIGVSSKAIRRFGYYSVGSPDRKIYLALFYFVYWGLVLWVVWVVYSWVRPFVLAGDWLNLLQILLNLFFGEIILKFGLLALLSWFLVYQLTDRRIREANLAADVDENEL